MAFEATRTTAPLSVSGTFDVSTTEMSAAFAAADVGGDPEGVQLGFDLEVKWPLLKPSERALVISRVLAKAEAVLDAQNPGAGVVPEPAGTNP